MALARDHGVMPVPEQYGSRGMDGKGVHLPETTYENPGPTANIRGIEPNTDWGWSLTMDPSYDTEPAGPVPRTEPFQIPDDAMGDVDGDSPGGWKNYDSASNNSTEPDWPQVGRFTKFGERYPGNA